MFASTRTRAVVVIVLTFVVFLVGGFISLRFVQQRYNERVVDEPPPRVAGLTTFQLLNAETAQPIANEDIRVVSRSRILCVKCNIAERVWSGRSDAAGTVRIPPESIHYMMSFSANGDVIGTYEWDDADGPVRVVELISRVRAVDLRPMLKFVDEETGRALANMPIRMMSRCVGSKDWRERSCAYKMVGTTNAIGIFFYAQWRAPYARGDAAIEIPGYQLIDLHDALGQWRRIPMVRTSSAR